MNLVPAEGYFSAKYALVGARPGKDEVPAGRPFVGASGQLLNRVLPFPRTECYLTNVRKDYSATHSVPTMSEIHEALPALKEEISKTKANIIIALGGESLYALTGFAGIEKYRGSVLPCSLVEGRKVIGTYHPAACLHTYQWSYILQRDLRRAMRESEYPNIVRRDRRFILNPSLDQAVDEIIPNWKSPISVDIETFGNSPDCIGVGDSPDNATCFPFIGGNYADNELRMLWRALAKALEERDIIGQNIQFDITRLERFGFRLPRIYFDTMLAHHLLWPELGGASKRADKAAGVDSLAGKHSLAFLTSMYTDEPYYKDEGGFHGNFERRWTYNCKDVAYTYECYEGLKKELEAHNQWDYYQEHIIQLIRPVMGMQSRGFHIDFDSLNKTRKRMERETEYLQLSFNHALGFACNVKSPGDITHLIQNVLKLPIAKRTKTGKISTDEDTIRTLAYNSPHSEIFQKILDIRERRTMLSGFLGMETDPADGRYKVNFLIHGTDSSRLSSRAQRKGPQLQNIPYSARKVFKAAPGFVLVQGDLAKADATYVAYDAEAQALIDMLSDPARNMYLEVGADILGRQFTKDDVEYKCFKSSVHAAHYGMGPHKWLIVLRLAGIDIADIQIPGITKPLKKAEYFLETYHAKNPSIRHRWQRGITQTVKSTRTLHDSFNRIRIFLGRMDDYLFRKAFAYRPRSTVGGITNRGLRLLYEQGYNLCNQVHDSIAIEIEEEREAEGVYAMKNAMSCPLILHGREMNIKVDIQTGPIWGSLKSWEGGNDGECKIYKADRCQSVNGS